MRERLIIQGVVLVEQGRRARDEGRSVDIHLAAVTVEPCSQQCVFSMCVHLIQCHMIIFSMSHDHRIGTNSRSPSRPLLHSQSSLSVTAILPCLVRKAAAVSGE